MAISSVNINDGIDGNDFPLSYSRVDDAIDFIMQKGRGTLLAEVDIRDAYRLIPIHPPNRPSSECLRTTSCTSTWLFPSAHAQPPSYSISLPKLGIGSSTIDTAFAISYTTWMII